MESKQDLHWLAGEIPTRDFMLVFCSKDGDAKRRESGFLTLDDAMGALARVWATENEARRCPRALIFSRIGVSANERADRSMLIADMHPLDSRLAPFFAQMEATKIEKSAPKTKKNHPPGRRGM